MHWRPVLVFAVLLATLLSGCYRYRDVTADALRPGEAVRARISAAGAENVSRQLGSDRRVLDGKVITADASAVLLEVRSDLAPSRAASLQQRVSIPPSSIVELQVRQLDRVRTIGAVAAGVTVAAAAALAIESGLLGGGDDKGPDDQQNILIPLGRLPLPR